MAAISRYPGQRIQVSTSVGDGEAKQSANDFVAVFFAAAGLKEVRAGTHYAYDVDPVGVQIILK